MTRPDQPTVHDVLNAAQAVADTHDEITAMHREAIERAHTEDPAHVESPDTESTAL